MKTNWQTKKLSELCSVFADGDWIESKDQSKEGIRLIQTGNVGIGVFKDREEKARFISEKTFKRLRCTEILSGDCLISRLPDPVGRACIIPKLNKKLVTAVDCTILRFNDDILPKWFIYYSLTNDYQKEINEQVTGSTRQRITRKNLGKINIPVVSLSEQKRIVKILDETFEKLEKVKVNTEKNLQNSKELFESYLNNIFSKSGKDWDVKTLNEIGVTQTGTTPKTSEKGNLGNFIPFIKPADFNKDGSLNYENFGLSQKGSENSRIIDHNSVLMVCIGATIGKTGFSNRKVTCNQQINTLTLNSNKYFPKLFYYAMTTKSFYDDVIKKSGQATLPIINKSKWSNLSISFPKSIQEQKFITKKLDELSEKTKRLEEIYKKKLEDIEELKKSILNKAFSGEL